MDGKYWITHPFVDSDFSYVPQELQNANDERHGAAGSQNDEHAAHIIHPQLCSICCTRRFQFAATFEW